MKILIIFLFINLAFGLPDPVDIDDNFKNAKQVSEHPDYKDVVNKLYPDEPAGTRGTRVFNGIPASWGQFPHQALLNMYDPAVGGWYICGGSFIKYNFVLTAAHCLYRFSQVRVYGGILDSTVGPAYFLHTVPNLANIFVHESYNPSTLNNDIGLIYMAGAPKNLLTGYAGSYIKGINLPRSTDASVILDGKYATISGFGRFNDATQSKVLRYGSAPIISNAQCSSVFGNIVNNGIVCISTKGGYGTCKGDSGGPLVVQIRAGENTLVGVTSFGASIGCALGYPTGFSRTTYFLPWINKKLALYP